MKHTTVYINNETGGVNCKFHFYADGKCIYSNKTILHSKKGECNKGHNDGAPY